MCAQVAVRVKRLVGYRRLRKEEVGGKVGHFKIALIAVRNACVTLRGRVFKVKELKDLNLLATKNSRTTCKLLFSISDGEFLTISKKLVER